MQAAQLTGTNRSIGLIPRTRNAEANRQPALLSDDRDQGSEAVRSPIPDPCHPSSDLGRPGGHGEGLNTRSHPELGRENPQRRWYCVSRRGRVGRRQVYQDQKHTQTQPQAYTPAGWSSPVARQAHNLKVRGSNPLPATNFTCSANEPSPSPLVAGFGGGFGRVPWSGVGAVGK